MRTVEAHAKINLSLEVLGRREDGYHDLVSVMQTVSLSDTVTVSPSEEIRLTLTGRPIEGGQNLVVRAAELLRDRLGITSGCYIELCKAIPVAAGLGGGSADAATVMLSLRDLWEASADCALLVEVAAELGADIPFFLWGGTALVEGKGERVRPLTCASPAWYLLVNPGFTVSTADVFTELDPSEWSDGAVTRMVAQRALTENVIGVNCLAPALFRIAPGARECFEALDSVSPGHASVSGSGPTMFARFPSRDAAQRACGAVSGCECHVVQAFLERTKFSPCVG